jgi:hypothetical protein
MLHSREMLDANADENGFGKFAAVFHRNQVLKVIRLKMLHDRPAAGAQPRGLA